MAKSLLLALSIFILGALGLPSAQDAVSVQKLPPRETAHLRIFELWDPIRNQSERIDQGFHRHQLTAGEVKESRGILESEEKRVKADEKARGSKRLTREEYDTYNNALDANSKILHEEKASYYYYDSDDRP